MGSEYGKQWKQANGHDGAHPPAIELYLGNHYFAWTGKRLADAPEELRLGHLDTLLWLVRKAGPAFTAARTGTGPAADTGSDGLLGRIEAATGRWRLLRQRWQGDWADLQDQSRSGKAMALGAAL